MAFCSSSNARFLCTVRSCAWSPGRFSEWRCILGGFYTLVGGEAFLANLRSLGQAIALSLSAIPGSLGQQVVEGLQSNARVVARQIRQIVPMQDKFVGVDPFYLEMADYPGFVEMNAGAMLAKLEKIDEAAAWEKIAPSAVAIVGSYPIPAPAALLD